MTENQRKLRDRVMEARFNDSNDARHWGVELFGQAHRTAKSLQSKPLPQVCIESLGEYNYCPYAFYVHNPLVCDCAETVTTVPYLIDFCKSCRGVVKPAWWYEDVELR